MNKTMRIRLAALAIAVLCAGLSAQSIEGLMNSGQQLLSNGAYAQAVTKFRAVLSREPSHFEAQHNLAFAYLQMGRDNDAIAGFKAAIKLNGRNAETWSNLAVAYEATGNSAKAMDALFNAVNLDPSNVDARFNLATMYVNENQIAKAVAQFKQVIAMDGNRVEAYTNLAKCLARQGNAAEAKKVLRESLGVNPQNAEAHWELGNILWKSDADKDGAVKEYRLAINLQKTSQVYYDNLGQLLEEMGNKTEAVKVYNDYLVYLNDALTKEKIRDRINRIETGGVVAGKGGAAPVSTMQKLSREEKPRTETRVMDTKPVDISGDFDDLLKDEGTEIDLKKEMKARQEK